MRTRFRLVAALLALLALTASVAEQAWALACLSMESATPAAAALAQGGTGHGPHAPEAQGRVTADAEESPARTGSPTCPMVAASGMSCGLAGLRTGAAAAPVWSQIDRTIVPSAEEVPTSVSLSSLFRPPRG